MSRKIGNQTIIFRNQPTIIGFSAIAGLKEGEGNFGNYFDLILEDDLFGEKSFEKAERKILSAFSLL